MFSLLSSSSSSMLGGLGLGLEGLGGLRRGWEVFEVLGWRWVEDILGIEGDVEGKGGRGVLGMGMMKGGSLLCGLVVLSGGYWATCACICHSRGSFAQRLYTSFCFLVAMIEHAEERGIFAVSRSLVLAFKVGAVNSSTS